LQAATSRPTEQSLQESIFFRHPRIKFSSPPFFLLFFTHAQAYIYLDTLDINNKTYQLTMYKPDPSTQRTDRRASANRRLAKVAVQCSADSFVVNQSFVLRINICGKNRHLRQAPKRYKQP
jgi:hypothetical protein